MLPPLLCMGLLHSMELRWLCRITSAMHRDIQMLRMCTRTERGSGMSGGLNFRIIVLTIRGSMGALRLGLVRVTCGIWLEGGLDGFGLAGFTSPWLHLIWPSVMAGTGMGTISCCMTIRITRLVPGVQPAAGGFCACDVSGGIAYSPFFAHLWIGLYVWATLSLPTRVASHIHGQGCFHGGVAPVRGSVAGSVCGWVLSEQYRLASAAYCGCDGSGEAGCRGDCSWCCRRACEEGARGHQCGIRHRAPEAPWGDAGGGREDR
ncbi:MAG: hypothetical protein JWQ49_3678 [Edaphobacter sp.]|nr:hypothetical protein [Edaphobacter sp.]